jgi:hypothetical protein
LGEKEKKHYVGRDLDVLGIRAVAKSKGGKFHGRETPMCEFPPQQFLPKKRRIPRDVALSRSADHKYNKGGLKQCALVEMVSQCIDSTAPPRGGKNNE